MTAPLPTASRWNTYSRSRYPRLWDGCVGAWCPSLGASGTRLFDFSGRQNWGTLTNMDAATDWVVSSGGYALDFDGSNDQVVASQVLGGKTGSLTAMCWAHLSGTSLRGAMVKIGRSIGAENDGFGFGVGSTTFDNLGNNIIGLYEGVRWIASGVAIGTGWHHIAMTVNANSHPTLWLDGASVYTDTTGTMIAIGSSGVASTFLGGYESTFSPGFPRYFAGIIDDWRVYDYVLPPEYVRLLARRRAIAYEPEYQPAYYTETDAGGGITSRPYAWQSSRMIGAGR